MKHVYVETKTTEVIHRAAKIMIHADTVKTVCGACGYPVDISDHYCNNCGIDFDNAHSVFVREKTHENDDQHKG